MKFLPADGPMKKNIPVAAANKNPPTLRNNIIVGIVINTMQQEHFR